MYFKIMKHFNRFLYITIIITIPFAFWAKLQILPTFDDWITITANYNNSDLYELFYRHGSFWRPFDELIRYFFSNNIKYYPHVGHIIIFLGHLLNTLLVYLISKKLLFDKFARSIATTFFYLSPCMLATLWACDSINQTYSQFWGLLTILYYLNFQGKIKYIGWFIFVFIATLTKENGIIWAIVPPIIAFGFNIIDYKKFKKEVLFAFGIIILYVLIRFSIPVIGEFDTEYSTFTFSRKIKHIGIILGFTWIAIDYVYLLHEPSRNLPIVIITFILSFPFILFIFKHTYIWKTKKFIALVLSAFLAILPNLITNVSLMNTYASLGMSAILVGYLVNYLKQKRIYITFILYIISALFIDIHLWYTSWKSSLTGKEMAQQAILKTEKPVNKVYTITVQDNIRKLSSFCVSPCEAFGWGISVIYETNKKWPTELCDSTVDYNTSQEIINEIAQSALNEGYDCVWVINKKNIDVIK